MSVGAVRPFPADVLDRFAPHFDALDEGRLLVRRCPACGRLQWPPRICCRHCNALELEWVPAAAEGTIYSFTVCHRAFHPWFAERTPFGIVVADVEPGVRLVGNCFSDAVHRLACGQRVRADTSLRADGRAILCWEPVG